MTKRIYIVAIIFFLSVFIWYTPQIFSKIVESEISRHLENPVTLEGIQIEGLSPLILSLNNLQTQSEKKQIRIGQIKITFDLAKLITWFQQQESLEFRVETQEGQFESAQQKIDFELKSSSKIERQKLIIPNSDLIIAGITTHFSGFYEMDARTLNIDFFCEVEDLEKSLQKTENLSFSKWAGLINYKINLQKKYHETPEVAGHFRLESFKSSVKWGNQNTQIKGELLANLEGDFHFKEVFSFNSLSWFLDATKLEISQASLFTKPSGVKLVTSGLGEKKEKFYIKNFNLDFLDMSVMAETELTASGAFKSILAVPNFSYDGYEAYFPILSGQPVTGSMEVHGFLQQDEIHPGNLIVNLDTLKIQNFKAALTYNQDNLKINGPASGSLSLTVNGSVNPTQWLESDFVVEGNAEAQLPDMFYKSYLATDPLVGHRDSPTQPASFLPNSKIFNQLKMKAHVQAAGLQVDQLSLRGINVSAQIEAGKMKLEGEIADAFSGEIFLKEVHIPLTAENPKIEIHSSFSNLNLEQFLGALFPKWKNLASGEFTGDVKATSLLPSSPDFFDFLTAKGQFTLQNALLQTLHFDQIVKSALSQLPKVGKPGISIKEPQKMQMMGKFAIQNGSLKLDQFIASTPTREEFNFEGLLDLDMNLDMTGKVFLVEAPVKPSFFEKYQDAYQRMTVPVILKGHILKPDLSLVPQFLASVGQLPFQTSPQRQIASDFKKTPFAGKVSKSPDEDADIKDLFGR